MTTPQRVDVERFDPCISRERSDARHVYPTPDMEHAAFGEYVKYEDYAALLQQLAENEARIEAYARNEEAKAIDLRECEHVRGQLRKRAEAAEAKLVERDAECERLRQDYQESCDITRDWIEANNALSARAEAAERAREEAEQDRWRTDWPEMTPVSNAHPSIWQSERVIVSLVGGRVTHDVAESFEGQRPLWFIHRDKVRAWQPFPAAFLAANGGRDE